MWRCITRKNTVIGIKLRTVRVMKEGQSVEYWPTELYTCSTRVSFCGELRNVFAIRKSFHTHIVWITPTVTRTGRLKGPTTRQ